MLAETVTRWTQQWLEEGRQKGLQEGEHRGLRKGEQRGLRKGEQKGLQKAAIAMEKRGFAIAEIAQDLDLSEAEVRRILKSAGS